MQIDLYINQVKMLFILSNKCIQSKNIILKMNGLLADNIYLNQINFYQDNVHGIKLNLFS